MFRPQYGLNASNKHLSNQFSKGSISGRSPSDIVGSLTKRNAHNMTIGYCHVQHTSRAYHRCIFTVAAVMRAPTTVPTIDYGTFTSRTCNIVQPDLTTPGPESGIRWGTNRTRKSKLATNDSCVIYIPGVITNSSPDAIVIYFNSSFPASRSPNQSQT